MTPPRVRADELTVLVAELVAAEPAVVEASGNLFELGLDSISVMRLIGRWRRAGIEVDFAELAESPTVAEWSALLAARRAAAVSRARSATRAAGRFSAHLDGTRLDGALSSESAGRGAEFELAPLQHAYWVGRAPWQRLGGVAAHLYVEFDGPRLDPNRLAGALRRLLRRHEMLRVRVGDHGRQRVADEPGWRGLAVHDLRDREPNEVAGVLAAAREEYSHQLLDIEAGEVLSTAVSLLPGGRARFHLDVDLVAADAVSYRVLIADLAALYADPSVELPAIGCTYREYLAAQRVQRADGERRAAGYWRSQLDELPAAPELPMASTYPVSGPARVTRRHLVLSPRRRAALAGAARSHGVTLASAMATAFAEVLAGWSAEPTFLLNVPMFERAPVHPDVNRLVGDFTSSVLLAVDLSERRPFARRVRDTQARLHTDAAHAEFPGVATLRELGRAWGGQVLAPVVFTSALNLGELFDASVRESFGEAVWIVSQAPQVLLDAQVIEEMAGGLLVSWDAREREFADGVLDAMFGAYTDLLHRLADDPSSWAEPVGELVAPDQRAVRERVTATGSVRAAATARDRLERVAARDGLERVAARDDLEYVIALLWAEVLGTEVPDIGTEFFAAGGDSVRATALVSALREALHTTEVSVRTVFASPTVAELAVRLREAERTPGRLEQVAWLFREVAQMTDDEVAAALRGAEHGVH